MEHLSYNQEILNRISRRPAKVLEAPTASLTTITKGTRAMADIDSTPKKSCRKCNSEFPNTIEFFEKNRNRLTGIITPGTQCIPCWRKEKTESAMRRYNADPQRFRDYQNGRRAANPELAKQKGREYHHANKDQRNAESKRYRENNPEKFKALNRANAKIQKAKRRSSVGIFTLADVTLIYQSQKGLCWWCGKSVGDDYHIDHRVALSKGGTNWPNNLCISCPTCNLSKHDRTPWEFNGRLL